MTARMSRVLKRRADLLICAARELVRLTARRDFARPGDPQAERPAARRLELASTAAVERFARSSDRLDLKPSDRVQLGDLAVDQTHDSPVSEPGVQRVGRRGERLGSADVAGEEQLGVDEALVASEFAQRRQINIGHHRVDWRHELDPARQQNRDRRQDEGGEGLHLGARGLTQLLCTRAQL